MKKVLSGEKLYKKMEEAINLLCDTVKTTLGPKGSNVIIDHSAFSPFITNDGVTIAANIESDDEEINTILELAKEAAIKTNETVGDGTTTTLVILQSIFNQGLEIIKNGCNPLTLKKELDDSLEKILPFFSELSWEPRCQDLAKIACNSAKSYAIGQNIVEAYLKVRNKEAITITEGNGENDEIIHKQGYIIDTMLASPYFLNNQVAINLKNSEFLLIDDYLDNLEVIADILNDIIVNKKSMLIMALDYSEEVINKILSLYFEQKVNIILLKIPGYNGEKFLMMEDLSLITGAKISRRDNLKGNNLGKIDSLNITEGETIFTFVKKAQINGVIWHNDLEAKRKAMLENGLIEIKVGAPTAIERREKKMRYDDAYNAIFAALNGVVLGGGITYQAVREKIIVQTPGDKILKQALECPLAQILKNGAFEYDSIKKELEKGQYSKVFNINKNEYEAKSQTAVIDPLEVVTSSLKNAVSIAGMLLTTTSLIINERLNNVNKEINFNDL